MRIKIVKALVLNGVSPKPKVLRAQPFLGSKLQLRPEAGAEITK